MLCDNCKKNEATVHIKKFHNGKLSGTSHLCAECAKKQEQHGELGALGFNLAELLFNIKTPPAAPETPQKSGDDSEEQPQLICPQCGWDVEKIRQHDGKLGCPECYHVFSPLIKDALNRVQSGQLHVGKHPKASGKTPQAVLQVELAQLQRELAAMIAREEYETAALCRDRISRIKQELEAQENDRKN